MKKNKQPNKHEVRQITTTELRVATNDRGQRTLSGYASVFNSPSVDMGGWQEIVSPSAFTRTLSENPDVLALYAHDTSLVLGRTTSGTLTLRTDNKGLAFTTILPDTTTANDLTVLIERGDISGCSFGFITQNDTWSEDANGTAVRTLLDVDLMEITVTAIPAYPDTYVSLRSAPRSIRAKLTKRDVDEQCSCPCPQCQADTCNLCSDDDCDDEFCSCPNQDEERSASGPQTKEVDGEHLTAGDFIYVGDPDKTDTWSLPWHFSTEEKTQSHLRDALARFDQDEIIPEGMKTEAHAKLVRLCKEHGIDVSDDDERDADRDLELRIRLALHSYRK